MTYAQAEQYLLSLSNLPRREYMADPKLCAAYLKRVQFFLNLIGNPEKKIPRFIHVTGTSGKGSVCSYLAGILTASGQKTGLYVSPHPTHLTERWQINHRPMPKKDFVRIIGELKPKLDEYIRTSPYDMVSFFDLSTIIALMYFAEEKVSWAVIEVGCGGRYDSTNVIPRKDVAVITNIGLDHTEILGNTKEKIAYEKAGIIKPGSAVFTSEKNPRVLKVIEQECTKNKVLLVRVNQRAPSVQSHNIALAAAIAEHLNIPPTAIKKGIHDAPQPLRFEIVQTKPTVILDGAHNPDKIKSTVSSVLKLIEVVRSSPPVRGGRGGLRIHLILGFSHDKNIRAMIKLLATLKPTTVIATRQTSNPFRKAADPRQIQKLFHQYSPQTKTIIFLDPVEALDWTRRQTKTSDIILITGSIFLSGELRKSLKEI